MDFQADYDRGERRWLEKLTCGHQHVVVTVLGDDYSLVKQFKAEPELYKLSVCYEHEGADKYVEITEITQIPVAEWE